VRLALEAKQVYGQHAEHTGVKGDPEPKIHMHGNSDYVDVNTGNLPAAGSDVVASG
jgi:hypothetical protein